MHRTRYTIEVTAPVDTDEDWDQGQRLAEALEDLLPSGASVDVVETEALEGDA